MPPTCLFRSLPKHIMETICQYAMPTYESNKRIHRIIVMSRADLFDSLGSEWKEVALEHYFRKFAFTFISSDEVLATHQFSDCLIPVEREYPSIKTVKMYVALKDLLRGNAAQMLAQSEYSSLVYPSVKVIKLEINNFYHSYREADDVSSTPSFYQQLMKMFPSTPRIQVVNVYSNTTDVSATDCEFEQFILDLEAKYIGIFTTLDLKCGFKFNLPSMHSTVSRMRFDPSGQYSQRGLLIRECALTLESLEMYYCSKLDVYNALVDSRGQPIEFPRLTSLALDVAREPDNNSYDVYPRVLLPNLTKLVIEDQYPFKDDVIFRCTRNTLRYVSLSIGAEITEILNKYKVLLGLDYPNIHHFGIGYRVETTPEEQAKEYWAYVLRIVHRLQGLSIYNISGFSAALQTIFEGPSISSIRYLKLETGELDFGSFCSLVTKLPHMTQIKTMYLNLNSEHKNMSDVELHDHFTGKYHPLSLYLQICYVDRGIKVEEMARCAMILVAICPRITRFMVGIGYIELVQDAINQAIVKEPFNRYADRLKYLVFIDIVEDSNPFAVKR